MFGYVRTNRAELLVKEDAEYKSVYCALCKKLGKNYGILSRFTLTYDCTFLALLLIGMHSDTKKYEKKRCTTNPFKKCTYLCGEDIYFDYAAAVSEILTYWKLKDDITDEKFFKRIFSLFGLMFYSSKRKKAAKAYPHIDNIVENAIKNQNITEKDLSDFSLDRFAQPSAEMLSEILSFSADENEKRILKELGYHLGRWIYFIDAADDIEKDLKHNSFNPFILSYGITKENFDETKKNVYIKCNEVLNFTLVPILTSMQLIDFKSFFPIIENILAKGLPNMQKKILFEKDEEGK